MDLRPRAPRNPSSLMSVMTAESETPSLEGLRIAEIDKNENNMDVDANEELRVGFYPELHLQRRIWILNMLRKEAVTKVLDVGCGEGQLLSALCQPAPWLDPPPTSVLPPVPATPISPTSPCSLETPIYNDDEIPNLHISHLYGLDVSERDLQFAVQGVTPPRVEKEENSNVYGGRGGYFGTPSQRWEETEAKIWKGGLEVVNEELVGIECIVSTEVQRRIEHLPPSIFPAFTPTLLGVYHPKFFLVTTPSYTFNARFTAPHAAPSARRGFPDPTGRTDRIFRHDDHKFEWTLEEFKAWSNESAAEWGYQAEITSIGRALDPDPWGRDEELGGATSVVAFRKIDGDQIDDKERERKGREVLAALNLPQEQHTLIASYIHPSNPASKHPQYLPEIAALVKVKMEENREAFMRVEELWFEREIAIACGGWIELLVRAVEESDALILKREIEGEAIKLKSRGSWVVELVGGVENPRTFWPADGEEYLDRSADFIPPDDWTPGEGSYESSEDEFSESTGEEGDVSLQGSEDDDDEDVLGGLEWGRAGAGPSNFGGHEGWTQPESGVGWGNVATASSSTASAWAKSEENSESEGPGWGPVPSSASSSTAGWDGDEDESDNTTS
ncbi:hypothetical protein BDQ12DRAFT_653897 [Crucibulum laeve]|uniref:Small RNA 2'-O-methyltransferase n=1 Tax=Crucibulum laeve TaxID=68775 RepID=A0A5C3LVP7_9AGAR|nr:hypothetical protein BDQ12DRAFT_653897 [Crucibulum laeve]